MRKITDEDFIIATRKERAYSTTGAYLDEALKRLEQAIALIDDIKAQVSLDSGDCATRHTGLTTFVVHSMIKEWEQK